MSKKTMDLSEENIKYQQMYCKKIAVHYEEYSKDILQFVFSAFFTPSVWEDAPKVYKEIVSSISFLDGEIPLMFIGGRSQNKITRKNQSIGFFITDYTIYVLEPSVFSDTLPKKFPYTTEITTTSNIINKAIDSLDWDFLAPILPHDGKEDLSRLLLEVITDILTLKKDLNIEHVEMEKSKNLSGRIFELGLSNDSCVKIGDYEKYRKHFKKVHKKFDIPDNEYILLAITDSTLAGPYGCVITEQSVYSKDLMGKPESTNRSDIQPGYPAIIIENSIKLSDNIVHVLPTHVDNKENIKQIMMEVLNKEITTE